MAKRGNIKTNGIVLEPHERATIEYLVELGHDIELIPRSNIAGVHSPDLTMDGRHKWEMKSPKGKGKWLMNNTVRHAKRQSENIIVDLRRVKLNQGQCIKDLKKLFKNTKYIKRMIIITKSKRVLTLAGK